MANALKGADTKLLSPAIRAISTNADGMARATLRGFFEKKLSLEDVQSLAPEIYDAVEIRSPSDTMFAKTQGAQGSESRTGEIMKEITKYGSATKIAVTALKELIMELNAQCARGEFPTGELNNRRVTAVEEAGLIVGRKTGCEPVVEDKTDSLKRFAIAGVDRKWKWAEARIDGDSVICSHPDVNEPVDVRYAFSKNPTWANLYNRDGLPASPFRTDDW